MCDPDQLPDLQRVSKLEAALAEAALSLMSYEQSYGGGGGEREAFDIARLLGYDDALEHEAVMKWLYEYTRPPNNTTTLPTSASPTARSGH